MTLVLLLLCLTKIFADHYNYKDKDILEIIELAKKKNMRIITTEKDYIKIPNNFKEKVSFIEIDLEISEENKLIEFIKSIIDEKN